MSAVSSGTRNKVFGVGLHKTGTKSLAQALRILGYRVTGPNGTRDPRIADNALDLALQMAPDFDAFQDNPWAVLFREMDQAFPRSKFVLTRRPAERWISSVVRHFGDQTTPMREWVYGRGCPLGNEDLYVARYRRHNEDVIAYFADRGEDLLVMDFEAGDGWDALCAFLRRPVPDVAFPHVNRATDRGRA